MDKIANTCGHYDAYRKIKNIPESFVFELINPKNYDKNKKNKIFLKKCLLQYIRL